jgi:hypothetical protein
VDWLSGLGSSGHIADHSRLYREPLYGDLLALPIKLRLRAPKCAISDGSGPKDRFPLLVLDVLPSSRLSENPVGGKRASFPVGGRYQIAHAPRSAWQGLSADRP